MKQYLVKIGEIASILCLIVFIGLASANGSVSSKGLEEVADSTASVMQLEGAQKQDLRQFRRQFGACADEFSEFVYYRCEDVMDVRELLIVKLPDGNDGSSIYSSAEKRLEEKRGLFDSYAPEQSALLNKAVLVSEQGFVFYAVGEDCDRVYEAFRASL